MLEEKLKELDTAQNTITGWRSELAQLHGIYGTKPSLSWEKIEKMTTQVYYLLEYMKVLTKQALAGTIPSSLSEIIHSLDPEVAKLI